jgi:predicted RNA-binding Zn ribbon-like protein
MANARLSVDDVLAAGFMMGGERLVALDLVDTVVLVGEPVMDLIEAPAQYAKWWELQEGRLPAGPLPEVAATRRLRTAARDVLDSHLTGESPLPTSIEDINAASAGAPTSRRLVLRGRELDAETRWHSEYGGSPALAAIAGEVIDLMADAERLSTLRRCANPNCSMLFLAEHKRRQWCVGSVCGNRTRVARHYQRTRQS